MAIIDKAKNTLNSLFQKMNRGLPTPDEYNDAAKYVQNKIIREAFDFLNNIKNNSKIGRVVKVDFDKERFYKDVLRKLLSNKTLIYNVATSNFDLPPDYSLMQNLFYNDAEIEEVSYNERFILTNDEVAVDEIYPVCFLGSVDLEVIPDTILADVKMYYYREAKYPKWTYNKVSNKAVFDENKSDFQDFELPDNIFDEIIREMAIYFSLQFQIPNIAIAMSKEEEKSESFKRSS